MSSASRPVRFRVQPHESNNERISVQVEFPADHRERRRVDNFIMLALIDDMTCSQRKVRQPLARIHSGAASASAAWRAIMDDDVPIDDGRGRV
jgi:hypothetical protein